MTWHAIDTWIVVTGALIAMACALPGLFLILNRESMLGDAISHAVLPGIAVAFLVTSSREPFSLLAGAVLAGMFTGVFTQLIRKYGRVEEGAALGVVFCSLFALGLILIRVAADRVHLDPSCVLYGSLEMAVLEFSPPRDSLWFDWRSIPGITLVSGLMLLANLFLTVLFFKELRVAAFDPAFASAAGFNAEVLRTGLSVVTAVTTVAAFESVGSILVIAMLIVPPATALLLSRRLGVVLGVTLLIAAGSAVAGHAAAVTLAPSLLSLLFPDINFGALGSAGMMTAAAGAFFFIALGWHRLRHAHGSRSGTPKREEPVAVGAG